MVWDGGRSEKIRVSHSHRPGSRGPGGMRLCSSVGHRDVSILDSNLAFRVHMKLD